jgi:periplasmic protein CpxP/Spy
MNTFRRVAVALAAALPIAVAVPAFAHKGEGPHQPGARVEQRLADLKSKLQITGGQESQWQTFEAKIKEQMANARAARQNAPQAVTAAPDKLARQAEFMKQRSAGLEAVAGALRDLYTVLTPTQRETVDQHYAQLEGRGHGRHGPMHRS